MRRALACAGCMRVSPASPWIFPAAAGLPALRVTLAVRFPSLARFARSPLHAGCRVLPCRPLSSLFYRNRGPSCFRARFAVDPRRVPIPSARHASRPLMASVSGERVLCSRGARPWQSSRYKTCSRCRERRPHPRSTSQSRSSAALPSSLPAAPTFCPALAETRLAGRVLCSRCARPWQSTR